jgi:hypothetical protein
MTPDRRDPAYLEVRERARLATATDRVLALIADVADARGQDPRRLAGVIDWNLVGFGPRGEVDARGVRRLLRHAARQLEAAPDA